MDSFSKIIADAFPAWRCANMHLNAPGQETADDQLIKYLINSTWLNLLISMEATKVHTLLLHFCLVSVI